jgi:hypothetical protein
MNEIEDKMKDLEFKNPEDEERFYRAEGNIMNANSELEYIQR